MLNHESDAQWLQRQDDRITALEDGQKHIIDLLTPISRTYTTATVMGKWLMALAVFISISIGVLLSLQKFFKP